MGKGFITVRVTAGDADLPVSNARVLIKTTRDGVLYETVTNENGETGIYAVAAPDMLYTLDAEYKEPAYAVVDVEVFAEGFVTVRVHGVQIVDTQTTILPVLLPPLAEEVDPKQELDIDLPPVALLIPLENRQDEVPPLNAEDALPSIVPPDEAPPPIEPYSPGPFDYLQTGDRGITLFDDTPLPDAEGIAEQTRPFGLTGPVFIPDYITVHLGAPTNAGARNVRVKFPDYIKNVVSSEIYSTWPENSLLANIHAIVTFALNRVYTEWYRVRGYNFDITNSTSYDQFYREGGPIFDNISKLVDDVFNVYARRIGFRNPFFTQFCNGTTVTCAGLSQWGTVTLANQGKSPIEILRYYYPDDMELVESNDIQAIVTSYPGTALQTGSQGENVLRMQNFLNRIRVNYPLIPQIANPNGVFGADTAEAVRVFQRTFNMTADGIIGKATWNKISFIYVGVTRLAELDSEGDRVSIGQNPPNSVLTQGARGADVVELQFILNFISPYYPTVPTVIKDGYFGTATKNAVVDFQKAFDLRADGVVGPTTWRKLYDVYRGIRENAQVPPAPLPPTDNAPPYPGYLLRLGSTGPNVRLMQTYLNTIRIVYPTIPYHIVNGTFDEAMKDTVIAFQQQFLLLPDGIIGPITWDKIVQEFLLATGNVSASLQFPGTLLQLGSRGSDVRLMQQFLSDLRAAYPSIPAVAVDGIFGPNTQAAVIAFQRIANLTPDGIIGPLTWDAIVERRNM